MIVLSFVLVVVAAATLVIGLFQDTLTWIWTSIASCVVAMIFLGIGVLQRRTRTAPAEAGFGAGAAGGGAAGTLVRAAERVTPGRPSTATEAEDVTVVPKRTVADAREEIASADTSTVEPAVVPKRTAPPRPEPAGTAEEAATTIVRGEEDEEVRPVRRAASRRTAAKRATEGAAPEPAAQEATQKATQKAAAKKATQKKAAKKATQKKAAKRAAKKATTGAAAKRALGEVKGVGSAKQDALLGAFGSLEAIRDASLEDLQRVKGIGATTAQEIKEELSR